MINVVAYFSEIRPIFTMATVELKRSFLHVDVLCVRQYLEYVLAGIGNSLFVYKNGALLSIEPIFVGERIHGIHMQKNLTLVKGGRQLSLLKLDTSDNFKCEIISQIHSFDWIQEVILLEDRLIGVVTAHNAFECWNWETEKRLNHLYCEETCILYSCKVIGELMEDVTIFAGTVFGDVLIWSPSVENSPLLRRLKAHNGAVFSIEVKPGDKLITTTSDDRSLKVWAVNSTLPMSRPKDWRGCDIQLTHTLFGHTARVWRSVILPRLYLTAGEDSQLVVWSRDGRMLKSLPLHQESGIRAVDCSGERGMVATGGEDGGVNIFPLSHLTSEAEARKVADLGESGSSRVCFSKGGLVYTLRGACVMVSGGGEEVVYEDERFSSYCVLEVSPGGEYIAMGSIRGDLVVVQTETRRVAVEEGAVNGRVYSIQWLGASVLTCGPDGRLSLWEMSEGGLRKVGTMSLPSCRERWTTCGGWHEGRLVVGDRMGGVHFYEVGGGGDPVRSFRKVHSYLGVTDVKSVGGVCVTVGRDGTMKEFRELTLSTTDKLPMEWPWKIVCYGDDVLILGFRGSSFIIWSTKTREIIGSHDCGGAHRSCDYRIHRHQLSFMYVKEKKVFMAVLPLDGMRRLRSGFHGKEINCLRILRDDPTVVVTGSEDTTLRVSVIEGPDVRQVSVMKTHISSVRAVCTCRTGSERMTMVSAGGKGQIVVWELDATSLKCREMVNHRLKKEDHNWKTPAVSVDPETRVMCVDILKTELGLLIAVGCSDCQIRVFSYREGLQPLCAIPYTHCVLRVVVLGVGSSRVLLSMGTDGKAVFWDVSDCLDVSQLGSFRLHQSGINSFHLEEVGCGELLLATGGDDNLISVAFVEIKGKKVNLRQVWENRTAHSCQVTGIKILKNLLVTTSIDQRITVWQWSWQDSEFTALFLDQCMTAVPDVQGMDATWEDGSSILVAVYGKGLETFRIKSLRTN